MDSIPVAVFEGLRICCQQSSRVSFFNSPWFAHHKGLAIDIYDGNFGAEALSPVNGEVLAIRRFQSPKSKHFESDPWEWAMLLIPFDNETVCFKILHVEPTVEEGEEVQIGTSIGKYIRNGYFEPWTGPHVHLEIRSKNPSLNAMFRASGALHFESLIEPEADLNPTEELVGQVQQVNTHFISVKFGEEVKHGWRGFSAKVRSNICLIDGGFAYYDGFGGIIGHTRNMFPGAPITIKTRIIGRIMRIIGPKRAIIRFLPIWISVNNKSVMGLSLGTSFATNQLKIVDRNLNRLDLKEGDEVTIKIL
ncbi:MAG: hypothetical protein ACFFCW_25155 [Candidatus Hodarchaeota archaeon]